MGRSTCVYLDISIGSRAGGRLVFELYKDITPKAAENFRGLCTGEYGLSPRTGKPLHYLRTSFFRLVNGLLIQGGDIQNDDGTGGECIWGGTFRDENFVRRHAQAGCLAMANNGRHTNGSQFYITLKKAVALDNKHVVVGQLIEGMEVLRAMQLVPVDVKTQKPRVPIVIAGCGELGALVRRVDPLSAARVQLEDMMEKHVKEQLKQQADAYRFAESESESGSSSSDDSENETAEKKRQRQRMQRKKQRFLRSALFKGHGLLQQLQREAAEDMAKQRRMRLAVEDDDSQVEEEEEEEGEGGEGEEGREEEKDASEGIRREGGREEEEEEREKGGGGAGGGDAEAAASLLRRQPEEGGGGGDLVLPKAAAAAKFVEEDIDIDLGEGEEEEEDEGEEKEEGDQREDLQKRARRGEERDGKSNSPRLSVSAEDVAAGKEEGAGAAAAGRWAAAAEEEGNEEKEGRRERETHSGEETSSCASAATAAAGRQRRLVALRMRINQGRKLNNKEVLEEKRMWNDPLYEKRKAETLLGEAMRRMHGREEKVAGAGGRRKKGGSEGAASSEWAKGVKSANDVVASSSSSDEEEEDAAAARRKRAYLNDAAALVANRKEKNDKKGNESFGWNVFNEDALYRAHKKRQGEVAFREQDYQQQKEALGDVFYDPTSALVDFKASEAAKQRLVDSVENARKRRKNFSRRRVFNEDDNVTYINERNRIYNEKIERAFGASTLQIRQNLERGTAL